MEFSKELTGLILQGGQIVAEYSSGESITILVRMPKYCYIQDDRKHQESNSFEFVYAQNYIQSKKIDIGGYKNGSLHNVKKRVADEHYENNLQHRLGRIK